MATKDKILEEIDKLPRRLKKVMLLLIKEENWTKSFSQFCREHDFNEPSLRDAICKYGTQRFWALRSAYVKAAMEEHMPKVYEAMLAKACKGDSQVLKLILQWRGELVNKHELEGKGIVNFNFNLDSD